MDRWNLGSNKVFNPPPLPYFAPYPLGHPQEYQQPPTVNYGDTYHHVEVKEEHPKVVVPNIEEELKYLSQQAHAEVVVATQQNGSSSTVLPPPIRFPEKRTPDDPNSGFMASYLKFLQGERDSSPPPQTRFVLIFLLKSNVNFS